MIRWLAALSLILVILARCGSRNLPADTPSLHPTIPAGVSKVTQVDQTQTDDIGPLPLIEIPLIIYIVDDQQQVFSSRRTAADVLEIQGQANAIWAQAAIRFKVTEIRRITVPLDMSSDIIRRQFDDFFKKITTVDETFDPSTAVVAFYVQTLKSDNGLHPIGVNAYFIADETSNDPGRTVAHELGHILGLGHQENKATRLMHSGANGSRLSQREIMIARQRATQMQTLFTAPQ